MNYYKDFQKWRTEKLGKLAFKMFSVHGLPLEDFTECMLAMDAKEHLILVAKDWKEYCIEKKVPKEYLEKNRKDLEDNKEELIKMLDELI